MVRKEYGSRFEAPHFKAGDKVVIVKSSPFIDGNVGDVHELVPSRNDKSWSRIKINDKLYIGDTLVAEKVEPMYEDDWILVKGGVTVPEDADVSLSQAGHVVAFRPLKKPKVEEFVRWLDPNSSAASSSYQKDSCFSLEVVFTKTDGVITDVRLEK